jgi:hypothetical protein
VSRELAEKRLVAAGGEKWRAKLEMVRKLWGWLNRQG